MSASLDIIICTYNRAVYLDRVLKAISSSTRHLASAKQQRSSNIDWGVTVVNNNSTDETAEVIKKHCQENKISNLRTITETKQGLNYARQAGILHTKRAWFAFIDDDCLIPPDWVAQTVAFAEKHPQCGAFGGKVILQWEQTPRSFVKRFGYCFAEQNYGDTPQRIDCLVGTGMTINRSALLSTGWLEKQYLQDRIGKKLISGGDVELALRLGSRHQLWYNPNCYLHHLIPAHRTTLSYLLKMNYGLGISQVMGDSLVFSETEGKWLRSLSRQTKDFSLWVLKNSLKALLGKGSKAAATLDLSFAWGRWMGISRLLMMDRQKRHQILGCAKVSN